MHCITSEYQGSSNRTTIQKQTKKIKTQFNKWILKGCSLNCILVLSTLISKVGSFHLPLQFTTTEVVQENRITKTQIYLTEV